jgi:hypothetical protein
MIYQLIVVSWIYKFLKERTKACESWHGNLYNLPEANSFIELNKAFQLYYPESLAAYHSTQPIDAFNTFSVYFEAYFHNRPIDSSRESLSFSFFLHKALSIYLQ